MVVMSEQEKTSVLTECHDQSNHNGVRGTRNRVNSSYYWQSITVDVDNWVRMGEKLKTSVPVLFILDTQNY